MASKLMDCAKCEQLLTNRPYDDAITTKNIPSNVIAQFERHGTLWYPDGTIILATPNMLFRVYAGILSQNSPVFRDMFSLPQPTTASCVEETIDDVLVVHVHDDSTELAHLLCALYDRFYYCHKEKTEFSVVTAILRLSTKYQIERLRQQTLNHLLAIYPDTLKGHDLVIETNYLLKDYNPFDVINIAREVDAMFLLPRAFYDIAINWLGSNPDFLFHMEDQDLRFYNKLSKADLTTIFCGRDQLRRALRLHIGKFLYEPSAEACRSNMNLCAILKAKVLCSDFWVEWNESADSLSQAVINGLHRELSDLCDVCRDALDTSMQEGRCTIWEELPNYFGLGTWDALRGTASGTDGMT